MWLAAPDGFWQSSWILEAEESTSMTHEKTDGMIRHTRLSNESREYLEKREELRLGEVELIRQSERVAALRRGLPEGAPVQDYVFLEGPADLDAGDAPIRPVSLTELFSTPTKRPLVIYHFMYGKKHSMPCPMCTMTIDSFNGVASHLAQNVDLAIVAAAEPAALRAHARARGWRNLRLLSAGDSTFKYDLRSEDAEGNQDSATSVFTLGADGGVRHVYTNHPWLADDVNERGQDLTVPVYNVFDLTPDGRGNWYARLDYGVKVHWGAY
jgi:predicted dithiol-disulfide oxidoreductase (DUF899 family)